MTKKARSTLRGDFKQFFGRGLGIVLPTVLTLWLLWQATVFVFKNVALPINQGVRMAVIEVVPLVVRDEARLPSWFQVPPERVEALRQRRAADGLPELSLDEMRKEIRRQQFKELWNRHWWLEGSGLLVAIVLIYLAGRLLGGLIGRRIYGRMEAFLARVPGFKQIYPHVKQVVDLVIGEKPLAFNKVVAVEYPRKGIWTVGFVTGQSMRILHEQAGEPCLSVFIPTTPLPFTGFGITIPVSQAIELPITIEEAIRYIVTAGVLVADSQAIERLDPAREAELRELVEQRLRSS